MKTLTIHPLSVTLGGALVAATFFATGAQQVSSRTAVEVPTPAVALGGPIRVEGIPTPDRLIRLSKSDGDLPFTVPDNMVLVITRAGLKAQDCNVLQPTALGVQRITFDSACVWSFFHDVYAGHGGQQHYTFGTDLGAGITASAGTSVDISGQGNHTEDVVLLGYLADA